jgi:uncharacterized protein involved in high-affinity Fe2+ transport
MEKPMRILVATVLAAGSVMLAPAAQAREYPIGGPVQAHNLEIAANYLVGIEMAPMVPNMPMGAGVIHLETDVHAAADNPWGFPTDAWMPDLTIGYTLEKVGTPWHVTGRMRAMTAKDGPHYANNVKMDGAGTYKVTLRYASPETNGFLRHVDKETGVPGWWQPFTEQFTFKYPQD